MLHPIAGCAVFFHTMILALTLAALLQPTAAETGITRTALRTTPTMEAARVEYDPGATEPPGNHGYDVVIVPVDEGMTAELEGASVAWSPGIPILISRGAPHRVANRSNHRIRFIEVRTVGDNPAGTDQVVNAKGATIVRSIYGKYIRATIWRFEAGAHVEWPQTVDEIMVLAEGNGGVAVQHSVDVVIAHDAVRVSRSVSR